MKTIIGIAIVLLAIAVLNARPISIAINAASQQNSGSRFRYNRLTPNDTLILLVDHQTGLSNGIRDSKSLEEYKNNLMALAEIANVFEIPVILSTSRPDGPNGPYTPEVAARIPNATVINRAGQINAWDDPKFQDAVKATGRNKIIVSGVVTEVCVAFLALSLQSEGFTTYAAIDSSGTYHPLVEQLGIARMIQAGVIPMSWFAIACELQVDWRNPTGAAFTQLVQSRLPFYSNLISSFNAASAAGKSNP